MSTKHEPYTGFQWNYFSSMADDGPYRIRAQEFIQSVDWQALLDCAADIRGGMKCELLHQIGLGGNHMVRILLFEDKVQWVARLALPSLKNGGSFSSTSMGKRIRDEVSTMRLVERSTKIRVPKVYACQSDSSCSVKAPFMLMECFDGNVGMDLGIDVPVEYRPDFYKGLAEIQVELSTIQLPLIGKIESIDDDGTVHQGPIPGLGGPFSTATDFFRAWCSKVEFPTTSNELRRLYGSFADKLVPGIESFPKRLAAMAGTLSKFDKGPFPLVHGDFGHNNVVVNDRYEIMGVIDWETAYAAPWEVAGDFPLSLATVPPAMDAPWNYDELGHPVDPDLAKKFADQEHYLKLIKNAQDTRGITQLPSLLESLKDHDKQRLMTAIMRLYPDGKAGYYSNLIQNVPTFDPY